ncbi:MULTISPECIES: MFS transporter [Pasteurellaceae]|uniref:MFS transporter n=1 Tax=Pasteurellaceae TaxID=712 RepID=UPI00356AB4B5
MKSEHFKRYSVLFAGTLAFLMTFMVWMMFGVIGIPLRNELGLSDVEFGILTATPVLSGSIIRLPLGMWTDKFGGRNVMLTLLAVCIPFVYLTSYATLFWHFLVIGLVMGLAGGSFSVGMPYVARWFPKTQQGLATGIFGIGTAGTALNNFIAPELLAHFGDWRAIPEVYTGILAATLVIFCFTAFSNPAHLIKGAQAGIMQQLSLLKDWRVLRYSQYYTVVFGGFVGLTLWLNNYYVENYHLNLHDATLLALIYLIPGSTFRSVGGYLGDRFGANRVSWVVMWVLWIGFLIFAIPHGSLLLIGTKGEISLPIGLPLWAFAPLTFLVGCAMGIGSGSIFKSVADDYPNDIGTVSGIVGLAGGLFGFILPIAFGALLDATGIRATAFVLMFIGISTALIWMHFAFKTER